MGFGVKLQIQNTENISRAIKALGDDWQKYARPAMQKAAQIAVRSARAMVPRDSGLLKRSIKGKAYSTKTNAVIAHVYASSMPAMVRRRGRKKMTKADPGKYAHLVELGTQPHTIGRGDQLNKYVPRLGHKFPGPQRGAMHPGTKPQSFLGAAVTQNEGAILAAVEAELFAGLEKIWNGR